MNELNEMPIEEPMETTTPVEESQGDETTPVDETGETEVEATGEEQPEETVDETPDPAAMKAEIERLKEKQRKLDAEAAYRRRRDRERRQEQAQRQPEPPPPQEPATKPREDDFENYSDYVDALTDWKVEKKRAEWERDEEQRRATNESREREAALQEGIQQGYMKYDDFEEVAMDDTVPITSVIKDILAENPESAADVAYYLGKNRTEALQIARMTPTRAAREIARIEREVKTATPPPKTKTTTAPPPIKPIGTKAVVNKDPAKMTQAEFEAWRAQNGARPY